MAKLLGEMLMDAGLISLPRLHEALQIQERSGGSLGQILVHEGALSPLALQQILAQQQGQTVVAADDPTAHPALLDASAIHDYLKHQSIPWQWLADAALVVASVAPDERVMMWARETFVEAQTIRLVRITRRDLRDYIQQHLGEALMQKALYHLAEAQPQVSAHYLLSAAQRVVLLGLLCVMIAACIMAPAAVWWIFWGGCLSFFSLYLTFKTYLCWRGRADFAALQQAQQNIPLLSDDALPTYTILVPLYKEAESIPRLMTALDALDYPKAKLDVKLVLEADDDITWQAVQAAKPSGMYEVIRVPPSRPRTKPKACNYALWFARGDLVTIYDAEDEPHPAQLRAAASALNHDRANGLGCVQAQLNYYNRPQNWLTQCFSLEYALWFDRMLPALQALGMPLPLGGTSNHLPRHTLETLGAWDPYNVTEDADLGLRLAMDGKYTALLPSLTLEEAPSKLMVWVRQRTRWIKGYMMTYLVHMRQPNQLWRQSWRHFWGVQLFIGLPCLAFLLGPLAMVLGLCAAFLPSFTMPMPAALSYSLWGLYAFHVLLHWWLAAWLLHDYRWKGMAWATLTYPIYWLLHGFSSLRALWQLLVCPHRWEKTPHGQNSYGKGVDFAALSR